MSYKYRSFSEDFARTVSQQPGKAALLLGDGSEISYRQLLDYVDRCLFMLEQAGVKRGNVLTALLPNAAETLVAFLACLRGGITYAPLPCTSTVAEVNAWKALTKSAHCLLGTTVDTDLHREARQMPWQTLEIPIDNQFSWLPDQLAIPAPQAGRLLISTSGSTGIPKAILLDGDRLWTAGDAFLKAHQLEASDLRFWNYLPMSYLGGLFNLALIPLCARGSVYVDEPFSGKTFLTYWSTVDRFRINVLWLVPTIMRGLVMLAEKTGQRIPKPQISRCFMGTAPISLAEKQRFTQLFEIDVLENYGLSETTFITTETLSSLFYREEGGVGPVLPYAEVRLTKRSDDEDGNQYEEVAVKTPFMMLGYLGRDGSLDPGLDADGYFRTGDLARIANQQLVIEGRVRDIIKKGGMLIGLRELEILAEAHSSVAEAVAVKAEHSFYGETYNLFIKLKPAQDQGALAEFRAWFHGQLSRHKWPERVLVREEFPRTSSGKIQKHLLAQGGAS